MKEFEIKSFIDQFDKAARKLISKTKKAKSEQLYSRNQILMTHGYKSSHRTMIDEEINSLIKGMEHDYKRLVTNMNQYIEKKGDMGEQKDYKTRQEVSRLLKHCIDEFKNTFKE